MRDDNRRSAMCEESEDECEEKPHMVSNRHISMRFSIGGARSIHEVRLRYLTRIFVSRHAKSMANPRIDRFMFFNLLVEYCVVICHKVSTNIDGDSMNIWQWTDHQISVPIQSV